MKPISSRFLSITIWLTVLAFLPAATFAQTEKPAQTATSAGAWRSDPLHVFSDSIQTLTAKVTKSVVQIVATVNAATPGSVAEVEIPYE